MKMECNQCDVSTDKKYCVLCGKELIVCDYIKDEQEDNWRNRACCPEHYSEFYKKRFLGEND